MPVDAPCPACRDGDVELRTVTHDIAYFDEVVESVLRCNDCGYRAVTTLIADQHEGTRHRLEVDDAAMLEARVVRSTSCTVRVPELGVKIEPASASDAYVTNVEGLLRRIEGVLAGVTRSAEGDRLERAEELLDRLAAMADGEEPFQVILDDPHGNSAIAHEACDVRELTEEEIDGLPTGMHVFEAAPDRSDDGPVTQG